MQGSAQFYSCPDRCAEFCQCNYDLDPVKKTGICDDGIHRNDRRAAEADFADGGLILCGHYHTDQRVVWKRDQLRCGKAVTAQMWMFEYHFTLTPILISIPFLFLITWLVPEICYRRMRTVTVVERLREVEN